MNVADGDKAGLKKNQGGRRWRGSSKNPIGFFSLPEKESNPHKV
jgi:hypothetical protein